MTAERKWDRTPSTEPAVLLADQLGTMFARLDRTPHWRGRLVELAIADAGGGGRRDPFSPGSSSESLAREVAAAMLALSS